MSAEQTTAASSLGTLPEIAGAFLRLGFIAFGGPAAHIALMEEEFVRRRNWLSRERFLDLVGAVGLLPGPSSTELAIYLGQVRGGTAGLLLAGVSFVLPAAALVMALAWVYVHFGAVPQVAGLLFGIKPVVAVIILQAIWALSRLAIKSPALALLGGLVVVLSVLRVQPIALLIGAGIAAVLLRSLQASRRKRAVALLFPVWGTAPMSVAAVGMLPVFLYFLKVGAVLFGSGYVLLAFLQADLVERAHWLTQTQLLDAVAVSQGTPGPFFTVATFIGYVLGGWGGALVATIGMFAPAFVYVAGTASLLTRVRRSALAGAFLDGVNVAAVGLMAVVAWSFGRATIVDAPAMFLAILSAVFLFRYRVNAAWVVLGGGIAGLLLALFRGS